MNIMYTGFVYPGVSLSGVGRSSDCRLVGSYGSSCVGRVAVQRLGTAAVTWSGGREAAFRLFGWPRSGH